MPMLFEDQALSGCLGCGCNGDAPAGCDGYGLGISIPNLVKSLATSVGLRDPINVYEPGVPLPQVFAKYSAMADDIASRVELLGTTSGNKASLRSAAKELISIRNKVSGSFAPGASAGTSDRAILGNLVQNARNTRRDLWAAEKKYGTAAPPARSEEDIGKPAGLPFGVLAALAGLAIVGVAFASRRRS